MAGDWIKMRGNLWDDPRVAKLCDLTDQGEAAVIGALYWLWAAADQHTEDGVLLGLTVRQIDRKTGVHGFGSALCEIGWLADHPEGVRIVNFEDHNGASAKKRAVTAKRVANHRAGNADETQQYDRGNAQVTQPALQNEHTSVSSALAREREEKEKRDTSFSDKVVGAADAAKTTGPKKARRLPDDWQLPKAWGDWALSEYPAWTAEIVRLEAAKFADHWRAKSGKDATKLDWEATWRNWCRSPICQESHKTRPSFAQQAADIARSTVEGPQGRDKALLAIERDRAKATPPPPEILAQIARLKGTVLQ